MNKVDVIGVQLDLGASKRGVNMGPLAIRYTGLTDKLTKQKITWRDKGDIIPMASRNSQENMKNYEAINDVNARLYHEISNSLNEGYLPIVLGGDHSVAAGSILASKNHYGELGVIWMDAHGDFNNQFSSNSGNMHGMPFSAVCGEGPESMVAFTTARVDPKKCVLVGARDIDANERERLKHAGVTVFSITEIDKRGIRSVLEEAMAIASNDTKGIHISFDMDVVTPDEAPGVGTPVHSGITVREAFLSVEMFHEYSKVLSFDFVEVNPIMDIQNKTADLAAELILSLLGKTVF